MKHQTWKKLISLLLAVLTVVLSVPVFAAAEDIPTSGQCGDNVYWSFDETSGTLTISGEGEIWDVGFYADYKEYFVPNHDEIAEIDMSLLSGVLPRYYFENLPIKTIFIDEGISSIGLGLFDYSFGNTSITTIYLPETLLSVEDFAFSGCRAITRVYYNGTEEQWNKIKFGEYYSTDLLSAKLYFKTIPQVKVVEAGYYEEETFIKFIVEYSADSFSDQGYPNVHFSIEPLGTYNENMLAWNITSYFVQPEKPIRLYIPIPDEWVARDITITHHQVEQHTDEWETIDLVIENNYAIVTVESLGWFRMALLDDAPIENDSEDLTDNQPEEQHLNFFQRILGWFRNLFATLFGWL